MRVLSIDTALQRCSVALMKGDAVLAMRTEPLEKGHAEYLAPMAAEIFRDAGVKPAELDRVGVVIGPGGFAGVRVGLAFARALALVTKIDCVGVVSLQAIASGDRTAPPAALRAPIIDARRGQVYSALYQADGVELVAPFVASPQDAVSQLANAAQSRAISLSGNGAMLALAAAEGAHTSSQEWIVSKADQQIDPIVVAQLTMTACVSPGPPSPLYLRPPDAKPPVGGSIFSGLPISE